MKLRSTIVVGLIFAACTDQGLTDATIGRSEAFNEEENYHSTPDDTNDSLDDLDVSAPISVGGAFLQCQSLESSEALEKVGCLVKNEDGQKIHFMEAPVESVKVQYPSETRDTSIEWILDSDAPFHFQLELEINAISISMVLFPEEEENRDIETEILPISPSQSRFYYSLVQDQNWVHLGDNTETGVDDCQNQFNEPAIVATGNYYKGARALSNFTVAKTSRVRIRLLGACDMNNLGLSFAAIEQIGGERIVEMALAEDTDYVLFNGELEPGDYQIVISSAFIDATTQYDEFMFSDLKVDASSSLELSSFQFLGVGDL